MAIVIFVFTILAFYHFYVESFLIPVQHIKYRDKLNKLRNAVIEMKKKDPESMPDNLTIELVQTLKRAMLYLPYSDILNSKLKAEFRTVEENDEIIRKAIELRNLVAESRVPNFINKVIIEHNKIMRTVEVVNFSGWIIYGLPLVPFMFLFYLPSMIKRKEEEFVKMEKIYLKIKNRRNSAGGKHRIAFHS